MIVVLGASGNTGHVVASQLLAAGQKVRVVGRNAAHLQGLAAKGAETFIADVTDSGALAPAFRDADSAYVMIPPNLTSSDPLGYSNRVSDAIASAVKNAGTKNVVALSSVGADKASGTGPVVGLHNLEQKLNQLASANVLQPARWLLHGKHPAAGERDSPDGLRRGTPASGFESSHDRDADIGAAAVDALLHPSVTGKQTRELLGQRDLNYAEVTSIIGQAIAKRDLKYVQMPDDQARGALVQMGMSEQFARLLLEMTASLNSGSMRALEPRRAQNTTPTSYETFVANTFVPAYQQQAAA